MRPVVGTASCALQTKVGCQTPCFPALRICACASFRRQTPSNCWRARVFRVARDWRLAGSPVGKTGAAAIPIDVATPVAYTAFADAQQKGELALDTGLPPPVDTPSLWRPSDTNTGDLAETLAPLPGEGRTRASSLWVLASQDARPEASEGVSLQGPEPADGGAVWRVSGKGLLKLGASRYSIETGAEEESSEARRPPLATFFPDGRLCAELGLSS